MSAPADCWPVSDALALCSAVASDVASLSDACGSPASESDGCDPACSSPGSGERLAGGVRERERGGVVDVFARRRHVAAIRGQSARGVVDHDVGAVAQHLRFDADGRDEPHMPGREADIPDAGDRFRQRP